MTPELLLSTTSMEEQIDYQGDPVKGSAWYGIPAGLHTIAIYYQNFTGRVFIEGTISDKIDENTIWFPIDPGTGSSYVEFPRNPKSQTSPMGGDTGVYGFSFKANAMWVRARVVRSYFLPEKGLLPDKIAQQGAIRKIMMSL